MTKRSKRSKKVKRSSLSQASDEQQNVEFPILATATNTNPTSSTARTTDWTDRSHRTTDASSTQGLFSPSSSEYPSSSISHLERLEAPGAPKSNRRLILPKATRYSSRDNEEDISRNSTSIPEEKQEVFGEKVDSLPSAVSG